MDGLDALEAELAVFRDAARRGAPVFSLDLIRATLRTLGDPQDQLGPTVHVTGTNGKGSTTAFLRSLAEASGRSVSVFTSPHLISVCERVRICGRLVQPEALAAALREIRTITEGLSYFEALTAAAFLLFARRRADLTLIEVGAGGAGDATNVMREPAACIVTPVSRDHEAMFGVEGVAAIARIKSGIFRRGVPAIIAPQPPLALAVLREQARAVGAPLTLAARDWRCGWDGEAFVYDGPLLQVRSPWLSLPGRHQAVNAGAACAAFEAVFGAACDPDTIAEGLRSAYWPARLQRLGAGPLTENYRGAIWVDGAHNPAGAEALAAAIRDRRPTLGGDRVSVILALQAAKDLSGVLGPLCETAEEVIACPLPDSGGQEGGEGADPSAIVAHARSLGVEARQAADLDEAIRLSKGGGAHRIYVCGSLYLCGAALRLNGEQADHARA
ncbi:MAG: bifunctional folylpolyglutamate synthase/dihydrofolate synthase [Alphaproteobacteria bacterium]|nr:bifunctional folylpolyglutamate synthase/dihydrofolate synthase [Alphaproteobacteria bacterium]